MRPEAHRNVYAFGDQVADIRVLQNRQFESWVMTEVLPSIRKTGSYSVVTQLPQTYSEALRHLADEVDKREQLEKQNRLMSPKAEFYDAVAGSKDAVDLGKVAKVLEVPGIGRNNLFKILRDKAVLQKDNIPYQEFVDRGYFRVLEQKYNKPDGEVCISFKTLVYQKGLDWIRKMITNQIAA